MGEIEYFNQHLTNIFKGIVFFFFWKGYVLFLWFFLFEIQNKYIYNLKKKKFMDLNSMKYGNLLLGGESGKLVGEVATSIAKIKINN